MNEIVVMGHVVAKGRPRFVRATGHVYTPDNTIEAERAIQAAWHRLGVPVVRRPTGVSLTVSAFLERPRSHFRTARGREHELIKSAPIYVTTRPDLDNLVKTVKDALTGLAWEDDSQVFQLAAFKLYSNANGCGWHIRVEEYEQADGQGRGVKGPSQSSDGQVDNGIRTGDEATGKQDSQSETRNSTVKSMGT